MTKPSTHSMPSTKQRVLRKARTSAASFLILPVLTLGLTTLPFAEAQADSGTWTLDGSDDWTSGYNFPWNNEAGPVAEGANFTADFSTIDITANRVVTLTNPLTIGNMSFGDTSGSQTWTLSGSTLTLDTTVGTPTITNTTQVTISSVLAGNDGLAKDGGGRLNLTGSNTYTGTTTVNAGTVWVLNANAINGDVNLAGGSLTFDSVSVTMEGNITGSSGGTITKSNSASTLTLLGDNTSNSAMTLTAGNLVLGDGANNGIGTGILTLGGGSIRSSDNLSRTIANNLTFGSGNVTYGAASGATDGLGDLTFTNTGTDAVGGNKNWAVNNSTTVTFNNNWTGNNGHNVTKTGTGTLIFNGNFLGGGGSTFRGNIVVSNGTLILNGSKTDATADAAAPKTTTVNGGTLLINGDQSGALGDVTVNAGTLGGTGIVGGNTTIAGTLAPGESAGLLTFNQGLTLSGIVAMEIDGTTRGVVGGFDAINVVGALVYGGAMTLDFASTFASGGSFDLFNFGSQSGDFATINLSGSYNGSLGSLGGGDWSGTIGGQDFSFATSTGILTVTAIPEPSTYAMLGLGVLALALLRRRRAVRP